MDSGEIAMNPVAMTITNPRKKILAEPGDRMSDLLFSSPIRYRLRCGARPAPFSRSTIILSQDTFDRTVSLFCTMWIKCQIERSVQSDVDLHCPQLHLESLLPSYGFLTARLFDLFNGL